MHIRPCPTRPHRCRRIARILSLVIGGLALHSDYGIAANIEELRSPDGRIRLSFEMPTPGTGDRPRWFVAFGDQVGLLRGRLGLESVDGGFVAELVPQTNGSVR